MSNKPIFCSVAAKGLTIKTDKSVAPCCGVRNWNNKPNDSAESTIASLNSPQMQKVRSNLANGIYPDECFLCQKDDNQGLNSMRKIWNNYYFTYVSKDETMTEVVDPSQVFHLDINTGTECNSKCMTCVPVNSNFWVEEHNKIWRKNFVELPNTFTTKQDCEQLLHMFPNLSKITFTGGEPTIGDTNLHILNYLIRTKRSRQINLSYTTNLTGYTEEMYNLWKPFRSVNLNLSIDGYGKINDYIRYPFKWEKIERSLLDLVRICDGEKFSISLSITASVFNALRTLELFEYWYSITKHLSWQPGAHINMATTPTYVSIQNLPMEYRLNEIEKLSNFSMQLKKDQQEGIINNQLKFAVDSMISCLQLPEWDMSTTNSVLLKYFIHNSDKFRNRKIIDYIPELHQYMNTYETN